jgi:hypothetical protein
MTIVSGIEIDNINYKRNEIKYAIKNNDPIEPKLHVIAAISNPCLYARRYILFKEFVRRMEDEENIELYVVELAYGSQKFLVSDSKNKKHLQIRTTIPIWHKENMINVAVKNLLPQNYKAFAWVDADIEFESNSWALDTLKILNGCKDVVQLFSHCIDLSEKETVLNIFNGFGYSFCQGKPYITGGKDYWHPGFAWAMTRKAYEKMGGLYDKGVLGSGDNIMALSFIHKAERMNNENYHIDYNESMIECQEKTKDFRLGYIPCVIKHYYHGSKKNRQYTERWKILMDFQFSPILDITYDKDGILIPTSHFSSEFKEAIINYFRERKEDDIFRKIH